jgi:hypothetical protein
MEGLTSALGGGLEMDGRLCVNGRPDVVVPATGGNAQKKPPRMGDYAGERAGARPVGWALGIAAECYGRDKRRKPQAAPAQSPSTRGCKVRAPLGGQSARGAETRQHYFYSPLPRKRAAREPPPPQPTWNGRTPQGGLRRFSPFKAGPKGLQCAGCITMAPRINAVELGAEFDPAHLRACPTCER